MKSRTLGTPKKHLPPGYPLPSEAHNSLYAPIWKRAFEIHATAHDFVDPSGPYPGVINPVRAKSGPERKHYCDCYELAYQEAIDVLTRTHG